MNNYEIEVTFMNGTKRTYKGIKTYNYSEGTFELFYEHDRFYIVIPSENIMEILVRADDSENNGEYNGHGS